MSAPELPAPPMTAGRWQRVDAVMQAALECAPADRPRFLAEACHGDLALRQEVESLLAASATDSFLEHPAALLVGETRRVGRTGRAPPLARLTAALADRYAVERELGEGGMATVYLARDLRHRRPVAVKVLHAELADALGSERFLREIELTASLQHPHILPLFDSGAADGLLYYVMPYVEGETLRGRVARDRRLPVDEAVRLAREVADALTYAHGRGVVHRDVKPENILLQGGHALVADFGIALAVEQAGGARMTRTGVSLGTPQYMAPEQASGERVIDARVDVYALGAVLFEMLAGEPPFAGTSVQAVVTRVLAEVPRSLSVERPGVPPNVAAAVRRALQKLPADRFAGAADFAAALADPAYGRGEIDPPAGRSEHTAASRRRTLLRATALVSTGALLGAAALGWLVASRPGGAMLPGPAVAPAPVRFAVAPDTGFVRFGAQAISPDGRTVVFAAEDADGARLYVRRLDELAARPLKGTEGGDLPFFAPDGASIGFHADGALRTIRLDGGGAALVAGTSGQGGFAGGAWGEDGTIVYATRERGPLFRVPVGGGARAPMGAGPDGPSLRQPQLLPGGRAVLVTAAGDDGEGGEVGVLVLATGELRRFGAGQGARYAAGQIVYVDEDGALYRRPFDLARLEPTGSARRIGEGRDAVTVARGERLPAFDVSPAGTLVYQVGSAPAGEGRERLRLVITDRGGRELSELPARVPWTPRFSPDGERLAYGAFAPGRGSSDVWVTHLRTSTTQRVTADADDSNDPQWSPDGRALAYSANGTGGKDVVVRALDGSPARRFARIGVQWPSDWSRGGALLFTDGGRLGRENLWLQPLGDGAARPYLETRAAEQGARMAPDGRWVAYQSDETGRAEVYVASFPEPGRRTRVSADGGVSPVWSRDGRQLYYWHDGQLLAAQVSSAGDSLSVQARTPLFRAGYYENVHANYDVSPDGSRFAVVTEAQRAGRVVVGLNLLGER